MADDKTTKTPEQPVTDSGPGKETPPAPPKEPEKVSVSPEPEKKTEPEVKNPQVSVYNFAEIMKEKKVEERAAAPGVEKPDPAKAEKPEKQPEAPKKAEEKPKEPEQPKRRGRPPKANIVFLGGREASTLKDISENWLGKATISMQTEGRSRGQSESYSQNMQRLGRELMTTSEITTMPGDKCILQLRGLPPFLSPKYDLKKHPNYKYTAEFDKKKNAFRLESLFRHRPLRLKPEDEYTVYEVDGSDTDEEVDLLNFDDLDSDEFV